MTKHTLHIEVLRCDLTALLNGTYGHLILVENIVIIGATLTAYTLAYVTARRAGEQSI